MGRKLSPMFSGLSQCALITIGHMGSKLSWVLICESISGFWRLGMIWSGLLGWRSKLTGPLGSWALSNFRESLASQSQQALESPGECRAGLSSRAYWETSRVVQWLRLCAPSAGGPGSTPDQGISPTCCNYGVYIVQLNIPSVATKIQCNQINKY